METITESIYDFPKYYDLVFGSDCVAERDFIEGVNQRFLKGKAKQLFEPACGTGRLLHWFSRKGYGVEGIDLNEKAVEFSNKRLARGKHPKTSWVADMCDFKAKRKFDLAFNTINSFRHLTTLGDAKKHLSCMAKSAKKNAVYLIGLHLTPLVGETCDEESWVARRGDLSIITQMWTKERNAKTRIDRYGIQFDIYTPTRIFRIDDELKMYSYTAQQFQKLVDSEGSWSIEEAYDFAYDIDEPIWVNEEAEDVVYVLRKK